MGAFERYQEGKFVSGTEWTEDIERAWEVTHDLDDGKAVDQLGLDGDHYYRKLNPEIVLTPEKEHLLRPPDTREGRRQIDGARGLMSDPQSLNAGEL